MYCIAYIHWKHCVPGYNRLIPTDLQPPGHHPHHQQSTNPRPLAFLLRLVGLQRRTRTTRGSSMRTTQGGYGICGGMWSSCLKGHHVCFARVTMRLVKSLVTFIWRWQDHRATLFQHIVPRDLLMGLCAIPCTRQPGKMWFPSTANMSPTLVSPSKSRVLEWLLLLATKSLQWRSYSTQKSQGVQLVQRRSENVRYHPI